MKIKRYIETRITRSLKSKNPKIVVIYGARQVGKTTLVESILQNSAWRIMRINGDILSLSDQALFASHDLDYILDRLSGYDVLFIDEAQKIHNSGTYLKIIYDHHPSLKIIVTGSSTLDLASRIKEPLTGRTDTYQLYPIAYTELSQHPCCTVQPSLYNRLVYGLYPTLFSIDEVDDQKKFLINIATDYLYKDVLNMTAMEDSYKIKDLLRLLAFQIGSAVSFSELGQKLGLSVKTVSHYIDLLEASFVIFTVRGFRKNLRNEVNRKPKVYFIDLGIRNAIIENFNTIESRDDVGALWENFLISERRKRNAYQNHFCSSYFWQTKTGAELDYIESYGGKLCGYEFKWRKVSKAPKAWADTYDASFDCINQDNFLPFIT